MHTTRVVCIVCILLARVLEYAYYHTLLARVCKIIIYIRIYDIMYERIMHTY